MSYEPFRSEDEVRQAVRRDLDAGPIPPRVQARLDDAYASLHAIPQDRPAAAQAADQARPAPIRREPVSARGSAGARGKRSGVRVVRRGAVVAVAAVLVVLLSGVAFAASRLVQMQPGEASFFEGGDNLPIYNSLQQGVSSLTADVGETADVDGVRVTLDSVSCDRNVVNLFFTLEKEGGFDLSEQSLYEGSQENEWTRLQRLAPRFSYSLTSEGSSLGGGSVNLLDAYVEDGAVKCMERIVPEKTLPDQVDIALEGWALWSDRSAGDIETFTLAAGLDLGTVAQPRELGAQDIVFATSEGDKTMGVERFTASELGTVMVVRNDNAWSGEPMAEGSSYGPPADVLSPDALKVTDDKGNVLTPVNAGDGSGSSVEGAQVLEFANLSPDATSVTFTPMLSVDWASLSLEERNAFNEQNEQHVDVSEVGAKLATSEYGGYELTGWDVNDSTVSIALKPYGWQAMGSYMELIEDDDVTMLESTWINPDTGESGTGYHSGIAYRKRDYLTGELVQMVSYYAAGDEELRGLTRYGYRSAFGQIREEADAAQTLSF